MASARVGTRDSSGQSVRELLLGGGHRKGVGWPGGQSFCIGATLAQERPWGDVVSPGRAPAMNGAVALSGQRGREMRGAVICHCHLSRKGWGLSPSPNQRRARVKRKRALRAILGRHKMSVVHILRDP